MKRILITCLFLCCAGWLGAEPPTLTWDDCVRMAARNNPDLLSALQAMEANRAQYRGSFNGILPHLSLSNSYTDSSTSRVGILNTGQTGVITNESQLWTAQGNASLDLIDFSQWANIQNAAAVLHQGQANYEIAATNTLLGLYKAFSAVLYAQEEIRVNISIRSTWETNAQMIDLRYQSGSESKGNRMNTQAQLLQAQSDVAQAGRDLQVAQQQLGQSLGMDQFSALAVTGTWTAPQAPAPAPDFDTLLAREPRIQFQEAVVEQARAAIKTAHSTLWPTLGLSYIKGTQGASEFPKDPFWAFTGTVNYPLFGNGPTSTYYAGAATQRTYEKAQLDQRSLRNQVRTDLETAWSAFSQAQDQVQVQRAFLQAAFQRKEESDVRYQSGLMTFEEWILVVGDYVNFQKSFLRAEQNLILTEAQWRFARGEQLGESL